MIVDISEKNLEQTIEAVLLAGGPDAYEIQENIDMESYRIEKTGSGKISLSRDTGKLEPMGPKGIYLPPTEEIEPLSQIIFELNERFGTDFTDEDKVFIEQLEE